jgi:Arc/MetJ-type ribon-helix-helix transcriptional regulator
MPKLTEKLERNVQKIHPVVDPITVDRINDLLATGDFKGLSDLIRKAIEFLHRQYEIEGKLKPKNPPKSAEERIKNAVLVNEKEISFE